MLSLTCQLLKPFVKCPRVNLTELLDIFPYQVGDSVVVVGGMFRGKFSKISKVLYRSNAVELCDLEKMHCYITNSWRLPQTHIKDIKLADPENPDIPITVRLEKLSDDTYVRRCLETSKEYPLTDLFEKQSTLPDPTADETWATPAELAIKVTLDNAHDEALNQYIRWNLPRYNYTS